MKLREDRLKGIIFDCDGVMIDSRSANAEFYNRILQHFGLPPLTVEQEAYTFMATARQAMEYITPPECHPLLDEVCRDVVNYRRDIFPLITLMPGFLEFVGELRGRVQLGVNTNRVGGGMQRILDKFNLPPYFNPVVTADDAAPKPSPAGLELILRQWHCGPEDVLFVGDSPHDKAAAASAGVCFAAFGNAELTGDITVDNYSELAERLPSFFLPQARKIV